MHPIQHPTTDRLAQIIDLINRQETGSPHELAQKVGVKKARLMQFMKMIKQTGIGVEYSRSKSTYLFVQDKKFVLQCRIVEKADRL